MRDLKKNQWKTLYIGIYHDEEIIYQRDQDGSIVYTEIDGDIIPVEIGEKPSGYEVVEKPIKVNLSMSGGEAEAMQYGVSLSDYEAKFTTSSKKYPVTETSLLWDSEPVVDSSGRADGKTANWRVVKIHEGINGMTYLLQRYTR